MAGRAARKHPAGLLHRKARVDYSSLLPLSTDPVSPKVQAAYRARIRPSASAIDQALRRSCSHQLHPPSAAARRAFRRAHEGCPALDQGGFCYMYDAE